MSVLGHKAMTLGQLVSAAALWLPILSSVSSNSFSRRRHKFESHFNSDVSTSNEAILEELVNPFHNNKPAEPWWHSQGSSPYEIFKRTSTSRTGSDDRYVGRGLGRKEDVIKGVVKTNAIKYPVNSVGNIKEVFTSMKLKKTNQSAPSKSKPEMW